MEDFDNYEPPARECNGCTACCEGWLQAEALGKRFFPGQPCHWMSCNGCTVYEARPEVCQNFICAWKVNHFLPEWFKPTESNIICVWRRWKAEDECEPEHRGGLYLSITEAGGQIPSRCLTWINNYANEGLLNVKYQLEGRWHWVGSKEFSDWCASGSPSLELATTKPH